MAGKKKKPDATAVVSDELPASALAGSEPVAGQTPIPQKDFRKAHLNAGFYDENGVAWTENSYTLPDGSGDTFGPGHPNPPAKLAEVRSRNHKPSAE